MTLKVGVVKPKHKLRVALVKSEVEEAEHHVMVVEEEAEHHVMWWRRWSIT